MHPEKFITKQSAIVLCEQLSFVTDQIGASL